MKFWTSQVINTWMLPFLLMFKFSKLTRFAIAGDKFWNSLSDKLKDFKPWHWNSHFKNEKKYFMNSNGVFAVECKSRRILLVIHWCDSRQCLSPPKYARVIWLLQAHLRDCCEHSSTNLFLRILFVYYCNHICQKRAF